MNKKMTLGIIVLLALIVVVFGIFRLNSPSVENEMIDDVEENIESAFALEDVSMHNSESDCWVVYDEKVYDITEFLSKHKAPLGEYCGTSQEFQEAYMKQHKGTKDNILNQFEIGNLM